MHSNKQNSLILSKQEILEQQLDLKTSKQEIPYADEKSPYSIGIMDFPDPVIGIAVEPKTKADVDKLGMALGKLAEEDPTFQVKTDEDSGQTLSQEWESCT